MPAEETGEVGTWDKAPCPACKAVTHERLGGGEGAPSAQLSLGPAHARLPQAQHPRFAAPDFSKGVSGLPGGRECGLLHLLFLTALLRFRVP